ncbi:TniQ family protein [Paraburkholderia sp. USG1]|uniref:TniQ family protein n=1 Tax=Paraburkholderia sp. USG1 TaxID=2952268 RepID=UPI00286FD3EF|nr:TniQ family protein [Paraburkholderia sp. USG1]
MNADTMQSALSEDLRSSLPLAREPVPLFYGLLPIGVGTGDCEGLVSYLCRLALAHCVSVDDLVNMGLARYSANDFKIWRHFSTWMKDRAVDVFAKQRTLALRDALVGATGIQAVGRLSLASLDGVIDLAGMSSLRLRHCPLCYGAAEFAQLHRPLLWDLKAVNCCPVHAVRLVNSECGRETPQRRPRWHRVHMPGVCTECGAIAYACQAVSHVGVTVAEQWVARQSAMLISAVSGGEKFDAPLAPERIRELATQIGDGSPFRAAAVCGFNKARLYDWIHGVRPIKYAPLLALCAACGVNVVDVLRGLAQCSEGADFRYKPHARRTPVTSLDELREQIDSALTVLQYPSVTAVAAYIGCSSSTISKRLPEEAAMLTARWRSARSAKTAARRLEAQASIESTARSLKKAGKSVTLRNVWLESGICVSRGSRFEEPFRRAQAAQSDEPGHPDALV